MRITIEAVQILSMLIRSLCFVICMSLCGCATGQTKDESTLTRRYREGEVYGYYIFNRQFIGSDLDNSYEGHATARVVAEPTGAMHEEFEWHDITKNGKKHPIAPEYRQILSLAVGGKMIFPPTAMITGATTDTMNFYVNEMLAIKKALRKVGDHELVSLNGKPSPWLDRARGFNGFDCQDFDIMLTAIDGNYATVKVANIPPLHGCTRPPLVAWMNSRVADTENNFFEIERQADGTYHASYGKEIIDTELHIDLGTGRIISGFMHNTVHYLQRVCKDESVLDCGEPKDKSLARETVLVLEK
ncbi:MAG: hypothetical protein HY074_03890 [Deltaproteobacteria bacterium]|nr:hypothetical protein [Deltaproteobacteria bacterium]